VCARWNETAHIFWLKYLFIETILVLQKTHLDVFLCTLATSWWDSHPPCLPDLDNNSLSQRKNEVSMVHHQLASSLFYKKYCQIKFLVFWWWIFINISAKADHTKQMQEKAQGTATSMADAILIFIGLNWSGAHSNISIFKVTTEVPTVLWLLLKMLIKHGTCLALYWCSVAPPLTDSEWLKYWQPNK
jgi:hypothetical protein